MDPTVKDELSAQSNNLRAELKVWEKQFSTANGGKKASRGDIKNNPDIAAKYKEYNKVRDYLSGKLPYPLAVPISTINHTPRKRKREEPRDNEVSSKRQILSKTPSKTPLKAGVQPWEVDPYDTPSHVRSLFTPSKKALGPTPQKDGLVLGLFDLLEPPTPSVNKSVPSYDAENTSRATESTPRKSKEDFFERHKHSRTPASSSKRNFLDAFATPLKNKDFNAQTPSTVSKLHFSTPSFLRRDSQRISQASISQEGELGMDISPQAIRVPRKPFARGLSSILAGLRKIEEEAHDDDLEALHEMEAEEAAMAGASKPLPKAASLVPLSKDMIQVEDSQQPHLLGGFDDEGGFDSAGEDNIGPDGQPLRVYKKKGQKRTTRRTNLKPSRVKPGTKLDAVSEQHSDADHSPPPSIPETQLVDSNTCPGDQELEGRNYDSSTESDWTESEGGTRTKRIGGSRKDKRMNRDGKVKRAARKVTAYANQNFKRLKLRNSGAKGGPGVVSRFRRKK